MAAPTDILWLPYAFPARITARAGHMQAWVADRLPTTIEDRPQMRRAATWHTPDGVDTFWVVDQDGGWHRPVRDLDGKSPVDLARLIEIVQTPMLACRWADYPLHDPETPAIEISPFDPVILQAREGVTIDDTNQPASLSFAARAATALHLRDGMVMRAVPEPTLGLTHSRTSVNPVVWPTEARLCDEVLIRFDELELYLGSLDDMHVGSAMAGCRLELSAPDAIQFNSERHAATTACRLARALPEGFRKAPANLGYYARPDEPSDWSVLLHAFRRDGLTQETSARFHELVTGDDYRDWRDIESCREIDAIRRHARWIVRRARQLQAEDAPAIGLT